MQFFQKYRLDQILDQTEMAHIKMQYSYLQHLLTHYLQCLVNNSISGTFFDSVNNSFVFMMQYVSWQCLQCCEFSEWYMKDLLTQAEAHQWVCANVTGLYHGLKWMLLSHSGGFTVRLWRHSLFPFLSQGEVRSVQQLDVKIQTRVKGKYYPTVQCLLRL